MKPNLRAAALFPLLAFAACESVTPDTDGYDANAACTVPFDPASVGPLPTDLASYTHAGPQGPAEAFSHGVASGDPTEDAVILWTRVTTDVTSPEVVPVFYEVALDEAFTDRVAAGEVTTGAFRDHTVKVDVTGLKWGRDYFYRFHALGRTSPVGKTRLAPGEAGARCARFAVVSCSSYAHGYFHAYGHIAARPDVDLVLHLGDYIYEYGTDQYGGVRAYEPAHEIKTLADYRTRYAQYRRDPDLQAIHRAHPMIAVWDDHETADNSFADGANNHQDDEGDWQLRKAVATQAYFEWMPIRDNPAQHIWRAFRYGELADLIFLDTRIAGRDEQIGDPAGDGPERHILGDEQEAWLRAQLRDGSGQWRIIGQQVMVAHLQSGSVPFNMDQWDGYSNARGRLFDMLAEYTDENAVVLTGDIHSSWGLELARDPFAADYDPARDNLGVEFVVPGITSPGFPTGIGDLASEKFANSNPHLKYSNLEQRGYMLLDVDPKRVQADYYVLDGVEKNQGTQTFDAGLTARRGDARLSFAAGPVDRDSE